MCFLQESSAMPHAGAGGVSARPGLTAGPGASVPALEEALSAPQGLIQSTLCWWHREGNAGPALRAPQPWLLGLSQAEGMRHTTAQRENQILLCILKRELWEKGNRKMLHKDLLKWIPKIWHDSSESLMRSVLPLCASQALYLHFSYNIILPSHEKLEVISFFTPM